MLPEIAAGKEIVIMAQSYGGIPGWASIEGLSVPDRKLLGKKGGVRAIFVHYCVCAYGEGYVEFEYHDVGSESSCGVAGVCLWCLGRPRLQSGSC